MAVMVALAITVAVAGELEVGASGYGMVLPDERYSTYLNPSPQVRAGYEAMVTPSLGVEGVVWVSPLSEPYSGEWVGLDVTGTWRFRVGSGWVGPSFSIGDTVADGVWGDTTVRCLPGFAGELPLPWAFRLRWSTRPIGLMFTYGWIQDDAGPLEEGTEPYLGWQTQPTLGPTTLLLNRRFGQTDLGLRYTAPPYPFLLSADAAAFLGPDVRVHIGRVTLVGFGGLGRGVFVTALSWYADLSVQLSFASPMPAPSTTP